ncbi:MAG: universal stress protein [Ornithinibacter sp.]
MTPSTESDVAGRQPATDGGPAEVLAGLNGSTLDAAVMDWASDEARRLGVALRLVHVVDPGVQLTPYPALMSGAPSLAEELELEAETLLTPGLDRVRARHPALEVRTSVPWGPAGGALVELSADAVRLVIGGSHAAPLERMLLGSVAVPVVAHARCPVVVVPDGISVQDPAHVVVGVDGSPGSEAAVEVAFETAAASGGRVTCVMGWTTEVTLGVVVVESWAEGVPEIEADCRAVTHSVVDPVAARHPEVPVDVVVRHGTPAHVIVEVADDVGADLVVVGSRGHGGFVGLLLGSVSRRVVDRAGRVVVVAH